MRFKKTKIQTASYKKNITDSIMRSEGEITNLILNVAESNDRIRAVLLNGSRANPKAKKDNFQDYDIVYIVREINSFVSDHSWIDVFGDRIILQMP